MDTESGIWMGTEWMTSYIMNFAEWADGYLQSGVAGLKISQFRNSAECVLIWENMEQSYGGQVPVGISPWNDGSSAPTEGVLPDRHSLGANVAFLDGHVDWWDASTWNYYAQLPQTAVPPVVCAGPNPLWCCPTLARGGASR
jgi:prepilin-type processing-associated H-X9-DG protein